MMHITEQSAQLGLVIIGITLFVILILVAAVFWLHNGHSNAGEGKRCSSCGYHIIAEDDDAHVCTHCGGRNRRDL